MSSARTRVFITETVGDPIPIVFFGGETSLKKALLSQLGEVKPEFIGISDTKLSRHINLQPYRVVWVKSGEEDWEGAGVFAEFSQVPFIALVYGGEADTIAAQILQKYSQAIIFQLNQTPNQIHQAETVQEVILELFKDHKKGSTTHLQPLSKLEKIEKVVEVGEKSRGKSWATEVEGNALSHSREVSKKEFPPEVFKITRSPYVKSEIPLFKESQSFPKILIRETPTQVVVGRGSMLFSHLPTEKELVGKRRGENTNDSNERVSKTLEKIFSITSSKVPSNLKEKSSEIKMKTSKKVRDGEFSFVQKLVLLFGSFVLVCSVPVFSFVYLSSVFSHQSKVLYVSLQNMGEGASLAQIESISSQTKVFGWMVRSINSITDVVGFSTFIEKYRQALELSDKGIVATKSLTLLRKTLGRVYMASMQGGQEDPLELLKTANIQVEQASKDLALFSSELGSIPDQMPLVQTMKAKDIEQQIGGIRRSMVKTQHLLGVLPSMLGQEKKKTYLVLIQNPLELRPSGGFLESFALVTVDKGRVLDIQVQDVLQADNVLKGKIEPPSDLKAQLGESQWFFRDSNWNTQFPLVAQQSEWFVQKELGRGVDGTIAINAYTLQDFLRVTGPVVVAGQQQEQVSADNILERLFSKSESLFQNENTSKKGFLSSISEQVFLLMQQLPQQKAEAIGVAVFKGLERGHILVSVRDKTEQQTLMLLGTTGVVMTPPCPQAFADNSCIVDTLYQVDANVGINRANYALTRYFEHRVVLSQSAAAHTYVMHYANTSASSAWPSGSYKNYIRMVIPDFAQVNSVLIDKKPLSSSLIAQNLQFGKREVGFQIEVPVGKTVEVQVNYVTTFSQPKKFSYALFTQKQAGTAEDPISFTLNIQKPLQTSKLAPEGAVLGNVVQFDTTLDRHQYLAVEVQ